MPAKVRKVKGGYVISDPSGVVGHSKTRAKAEASARARNAAAHGWKPSRKR